MRRFSIAKLMLVVAVLAAAFAALRIPASPMRTSALFSLVVFVLLTATLGSLLGRRPAWIGFCLFGWGWLIASFTALAIAPLDLTSNRQPVPLLATSLYLPELHLRAFPAGPGTDEAPVEVLPNSRGGFGLAPHRLVQDYSAVASLLVACMGGALGWLLREPQPRPD